MTNLTANANASTIDIANVIANTELTLTVALALALALRMVTQIFKQSTSMAADAVVRGFCGGGMPRVHYTSVGNLKQRCGRLHVAHERRRQHVSEWQMSRVSTSLTPLAIETEIAIRDHGGRDRGPAGAVIRSPTCAIR